MLSSSKIALLFACAAIAAPACTLALGDFDPAATSTSGGIGGAGGTPVTVGTGGVSTTTGNGPGATTSGNGGAMTTSSTAVSTAGAGGAMTTAAGTGGSPMSTSTGPNCVRSTCPTSTTPCQMNVCTANGCVEMPQPEGTICGGGTGKCDDMGGCIASTASTSASSSTGGNTGSSSSTSAGSTSSTSGAGGATSSSSTGIMTSSTSGATGSSTSTGMVMGNCVDPQASCPPPKQCYGAFTCPNGICQSSYSPPGTPSGGPDIASDCKKSVCDGNGGTMIVADQMDTPMPQGVCTMPACAGTTPYYMPANNGMACGGPGFKCDAMGQCNQCHDLVLDGGETLIDCGGPQCGKCAGDPCNSSSECAHGLCSTGLCN